LYLEQIREFGIGSYLRLSTFAFISATIKKENR